MSESAGISWTKLIVEFKQVSLYAGSGLSCTVCGNRGTKNKGCITNCDSQFVSGLMIQVHQMLN